MCQCSLLCYRYSNSEVGTSAAYNMLKLMILVGLASLSHAGSKSLGYATSYASVTQYTGPAQRRVDLTGTPTGYWKGSVHPVFSTVHFDVPIIHDASIVHPSSHRSSIIHHTPILHHAKATSFFRHTPIVPVTTALISGGYDDPKLYHDHSKYHFKYSVDDRHTGNIHSHEQERNGDKVKGHYMLHEADGTIRTVHYTADKHNGFNAIVEKKGHAIHPIHAYRH